MSITDSLQHVGLVSAKRARLEAAQLDAEDQLFLQVAREYHDGVLGEDDLSDFIEENRCLFLPGWTKRWDDSGVGRSVASLLGRRRYRKVAEPNGPHGTWVGTCPVSGPVPRFGQSVVYVLFDGDNVPCYVGSTGEFKNRLKWHVRDGKPVVFWTAYPCPDREAAYQLEEQLLQKHKPYLNKRATR